MLNIYASRDVGGTYCISGASWTIAALLTYQTGVPYKLPVERVDDYVEFLPGLTGLGIDLFSECPTLQEEIGTDELNLQLGLYS
jgi:hypothetical protein